MDEILNLLNAHPNIDVCLFNPFSFRAFRALGYLADSARLNRRMYDKNFTVEGEVTIIGGRNIGDAYFGAGNARSLPICRWSGCCSSAGVTRRI